MRYLILLSVIILSAFTVQAQTVEEVLASVVTNNKLLQAGSYELEAGKLLNRTGIAPSNPQVEMGVMPVKNGDGEKTMWGVSQSFSFPTIYLKKIKLAELNNQKAEVMYQVLRQQVLLEAKACYLDIVYLNQMHLLLTERYNSMLQLKNMLEKRMKEGDASILEVNKARLELVRFRNQLDMNRAGLQQYTEKLTRLNGGQRLTVAAQLYPAEEVDDFDTLWQSTQKNDPLLHSTTLNTKIAQQHVGLSRQEWLPDITIGYESEKTPTEHFTGPKVGVSIPLWEKRNTVKASKASHKAATAHLENYTLELRSVLLQQHTKVLVLKQNMLQYKQVLGSLNTLEMLNKSRELGHISTIDYLQETAWLYDARDQAMQLEKGYYQELAKLYRFKL